MYSVAYATVAATMCVKAPDYLKDMLVRAKLQFEGFDNATQPQKPHRESVRPVFALCHKSLHRIWKNSEGRGGWAVDEGLQGYVIVLHISLRLHFASNMAVPVKMDC